MTSQPLLRDYTIILSDKDIDTEDVNSMSNNLLPSKGKKKKISFLQDDDFFVIKKSKKQKTPSSALVEHQESNPPSERQTSEPQSIITPQATDNLESDDLYQSFHSARDSFSVTDADDDLETLQVTGHARTASKEVDERLDDSIEEIDDDDLNTFFKEIKSSRHLDKTNTTSERTRIYIIRIINKYGLPLETEVAVSGDKTFGSILDDLDMGDKEYPVLGVNGALVWVEGKSELKRFFKPSTLRIPIPTDGDSTRLTVLYIPPENVDRFESIYPEFQDTHNNNLQNVIDLLDTSDEGGQQTSAVSETLSKQSYFIIGLKGKDNKRIECEVGPDTKIRDLLCYYIKVKGIDENTVQHPKLVFDDEELDLEGLVKDTELEEEFEVQVYI